jgi:membrane-bound ClpP family serine protease
MGMSRSGRSFLLAVGAGFAAFLVTAQAAQVFLGLGRLVALIIAVVVTIVVEVAVFLIEMQTNRHDDAPVLGGAESLVGLRGRVLRPLDPFGSVLVRGDLWTARSSRRTRIAPDCAVRVCGIDGLTLIVELDSTEEAPDKLDSEP